MKKKGKLQRPETTVGSEGRGVVAGGRERIYNSIVLRVLRSTCFAYSTTCIYMHKHSRVKELEFPPGEPEKRILTRGCVGEDLVGGGGFYGNVCTRVDKVSDLLMEHALNRSKHLCRTANEHRQQPFVGIDLQCRMLAAEYVEPTWFQHAIYTSVTQYLRSYPTFSLIHVVGCLRGNGWRKQSHLGKKTRVVAAQAATLSGCLTRVLQLPRSRLDSHTLTRQSQVGKTSMKAQCIAFV